MSKPFGRANGAARRNSFFVGKIWLSLATIPIEFGATDGLAAPKNDSECSI